jgi:3-hydroxybutyryl-CoA dehydrogenase
MKVLVVGDNSRTEELKGRLPDGLELSYSESPETYAHALDAFEVIIDLELDEHFTRLEDYAPLEETIVLGGAVRQSLAQMVQQCPIEVSCTLIGMNTLPTFIGREVAEWSLLNVDDRTKADALALALGWELEFVADRVGMASPRVLFMVINEAFYTMQEGTAGAADIDLAMQYGTNYPQGPLAWAERIGIRHVYEVLEALYADTHDERYRICPLLKRHYLTGQPVISG